MRKNCKKFISLILATVMVFSMGFPSVISMAASADTDNDEKYIVTLAECENGEITFNEETDEKFIEGDKVNLKLEADEGYIPESLAIYETASGEEIITNIASDDLYSFSMPEADITVSATFAADVQALSAGEIQTYAGTDTKSYGTVTATTYNKGSGYIGDKFGITYDSLYSWLNQHTNDDYYIGTPYPESNGSYQYGYSGGTDRRNPHGDTSSTNGQYGIDDYANTEMMNCTGFVWHVLWKASDMSYTDAFNTIPAWNSVGASSWRAWLVTHTVEFRDYVATSAYSLNAITDAIVEDGYAEPGDILWLWDGNAITSVRDSGIPSGSASNENHVGILSLGYFETGENTGAKTWWHSIGRSN